MTIAFREDMGRFTDVPGSQRSNDMVTPIFSTHSPLTKRLAIGAALMAIGVLAFASDYRPPYVQLSYSKSIHVKSDGASTVTTTMEHRADTESGAEALAQQRVGYVSSLEDVEVLEAWTQTPEGERLPVAADKILTVDAVEDGVADFGDSKYKVIIYPRVGVGARLFLSVRRTQHKPWFPGHWFTAFHFAPNRVYQNTTFTLTHEPGIRIQVSALGPTGGRVAPLPSDPPGTVRYEYSHQQMQAYPPEGGRVALSDFAPHFMASTFERYADYAQAYQANARPAAEPTPAIRDLAAELTRGADSERAKVRRLYNWVSRNIRYVALSVGVGGYVPHPASSVLDHRYGDCKDHVALLEALLRSVGIKSSPALINLGNAYRLPTLPVG